MPKTSTVTQLNFYLKQFKIKHVENRKRAYKNGFKIIT